VEHGGGQVVGFMGIEMLMGEFFEDFGFVAGFGFYFLIFVVLLFVAGDFGFGFRGKSFGGESRFDDIVFGLKELILEGFGLVIGPLVIFIDPFEGGLGEVVGRQHAGDGGEGGKNGGGESGGGDPLGAVSAMIALVGGFVRDVFLNVFGWIVRHDDAPTVK
jgi:hypothetical protein